MSDSASIKAIQQRMQQVRHDLGDEMGELVESAKDMTDWRKYVNANPWLWMGVAAGIGYFLVPKRAPVARLDSADLKALARHGNLQQGSPPRPGLRSAIVSFVTTAALRGIMGYMGQRMTKTNVEQMERTRQF